MKENINIALSPNSSKADVIEAMKQFLLPWRWSAWQNGQNVSKLESEFRGFFNVPYAFAMNSGRESLYAILQALDLKIGDEIILQTFTCMVVVNSIMWNGLKPVYIDIDKKDFNMDPQKIEEKITRRTKAVMVQHTFGIPANINAIQKICKKHKLILIEDSAHAMGATCDGKYLGTIGDIGFFSLGRSKVISCVSGGMIVTKDKKHAASLAKVLKNVKSPGRSIIARNLFHPIAMSCIKKLYSRGVLGKGILFILQKLRLLAMEVEKNEKRGEFRPPYPMRMANAQAKLALRQFSQLDRFNTHRKMLAKKYYQKLRIKFGITVISPDKYEGAIFLRYPVLMKNSKKRSELLKIARKSGIVLGDWYMSPIAPPGCAMNKTFYKNGNSPVAEGICDRVVNLPTYNQLTEEQAEKILKLF